MILQYLALILDSFSKGAREIPRWCQPFLSVVVCFGWVFFPLHVRKSLTHTHCTSGWRYDLLLPALAFFFYVKHYATQTVCASGSVCLEN